MKKKFNFFVFIFSVVLVLISYRVLFQSYFEADEWFHFTYYFPLTRKPDGFLTAILSTIISSGPLSAGQHVIPIASAIYFLNTKFFGLNYAPYAFISLLLHAINSFLVFLFVKVLLYKTSVIKKNIYALLSAVFFAFAPTPLHAITGAAPFYGQNILSVTFFLLCILFFKLAFVKKLKKYIFFSMLFLFASLFTKETAVFLFFLLPFMAIIEKKGLSSGRQVFPLNFLGKVFVICIVIYVTFRFLIPNVYQGMGPLIDKLIGSYISSTLPSWQQEAKPLSSQDAGTIVSTDLSIHKNLPQEILFRTITFPIKMTGTLFLPRETLTSIVKFIAPIIYPAPSGDPGARATGQLGFVVGPGNDAILYLFSIGIILVALKLLVSYVRERRVEEARALATGLVIIVLSALPLVAIIFSFPRWGYDTYFDSRLYYNPTVGAALVFPFLLFGIARLISSSFPIKKTSFVVVALFILWLVNNMYVFELTLKQFVQKYGSDRREVVEQLKQHLPILPKNVVIYTETDGLSAYGPSLPFQTSVPQALTLVYYDTSPLPDSFFEKVIFDGEPQGYLYSGGRGFGYYTSKKTLADALLASKFKPSDIYSFYYRAKDAELVDITGDVRLEMEEYLGETEKNSDWKIYKDSSGTLSLSYPPRTNVVQDLENNVKALGLNNPEFQASIFMINISSNFDIDEFVSIRNRDKLGIVNSKKVSYDKFHYNEAYVVSENGRMEYFIRADDKLVVLLTENTNQDSILSIEKILGSINILEK